MIIYFNFHSHCIEFIEQKGERKCFSVAFSPSYAKSRDFTSIVEECIRPNRELRDMLVGQKNVVVLPDDVMGVGLLSVPYSLLKRDENFQTRFNMLYNREGTLVVDKRIFIGNNNGVTTYAFSAVKKSCMSEITDTLLTMGIRLRGFTFYSKLLCNFVQNMTDEQTPCMLVDCDSTVTMYGMMQDISLAYLELNLTEHCDIAEDYIRSVMPSTVKADDDCPAVDMDYIDKVQTLITDFIKLYSEKGVKFDKIFNLSPHNISGTQQILVDRYLVLKEASHISYIGKKRWLNI